MNKWLRDLSRYSFLVLMWATLVAPFSIQAVYLPIHEALHHTHSSYNDHCHDSQGAVHGSGCALCFAKKHFSYTAVAPAVPLDIPLIQSQSLNFDHKVPPFNGIFSTEARAPPQIFS